MYIYFTPTNGVNSMKGNAMDYLTAWRDGHEAGMRLVLKIINELTGHDFQKSSDVILYIKQLEGDPDFHFPETKKELVEEPKSEKLSIKEELFIDSLTDKIALKNWMWS